MVKGFNLGGGMEKEKINVWCEHVWKCAGVSRRQTPSGHQVLTTVILFCERCGEFKEKTFTG